MSHATIPAPSYNGWANYATWRVRLEMLDGLTLEDFGYIPGDTVEVGDLARYLKNWTDDLLSEQAPAGGLVLSYAMAFLEDVDWREIAAHLIADGEAE